MTDPADSPVPPPGAEITLRDVARLAGVSVSTASRVINRTCGVSPAYAAAVQAVLERFSYIPNNAARALVRQKTRTVGLVVPTLSNPLFAPSIAAIEATLRDAGYGLLVACSQRAPERELEQVRMMIERGVDGMILTGSHHLPATLGLLASRGVVLATQDDPAACAGALSVAMQDAAAMATVIDALVMRGHRTIGILTGPVENTLPIAERLRGAIQRLEHHGLPHGAGHIMETADYQAASSRRAARTLLDRVRGLTAIACTGDILAIGTIMECRRRGLRIPHDISIVGCGDTVMSQFVDPPLATIHLPFGTMGEQAARRLLCVMAGRPLPPTRPLPFRLIQRHTLNRMPRVPPGA
ncbi:LacI family DNA-binding transcriptional regulator [Komagataeibacter rhaeticus]|uniref:LacI family DNA-binding transcriptional regulator n=1 Tax=Komagataeibacter rhaeticus TaxID=215221 RepID=UPI0039EA9DCD